MYGGKQKEVGREREVDARRGGGRERQKEEGEIKGRGKSRRRRGM